MSSVEIPAGATIRGDIEVEGDLAVSGRVEGTLRVAGGLRVEAGGSVAAQVSATSAVIGGAVQGDVSALESIHLLSGCRVEGDLRAPRLAVEEGAVVRGRVELGAGPQTVATAGPVRDRPPPVPASALALANRRKRIVVPPSRD